MATAGATTSEISAASDPGVTWVSPAGVGRIPVVFERPFSIVGVADMPAVFPDVELVPLVVAGAE